MEKQKDEWLWIWRFLIFWGFKDQAPSISFYKANMEDEIWTILLTLRNVIKIGYSATFIVIVIVALVGEIWR